ncbi:hypothetical protein KKE68_04790, partial [Patescibacteria group bacterium]|nr:hypothetical protein [Patescibacteria group bacterium]
LLPLENKKDLEDVPREVLEDLKFKFVSHMDDVLQLALVKSLPKLQIPHNGHTTPLVHHAPAMS